MVDGKITSLSEFKKKKKEEKKFIFFSKEDTTSCISDCRK